MDQLAVDSRNDEAGCWNMSPRIVNFQKNQANKKETKPFKGIIQKEPISLKLQSDKLEIISDNSVQSINYSDILSIKKSRKNSDICIYYLKRSEFALGFTKINIKLESLDESSEISKLISKKLKKQRLLKNVEVIIDNEGENDNENIFNTKVKSVLNKIDVKCHETNLSDWTKSDEILKGVKVTDQTDGIFLLGGDKFISKVLTHLLNRTDQDNTNYFRTPFAIIPTGKTNEIFAAFSDETDIEQIFLRYLTGRSIQVDLLSVCVNNQDTYWGFNCQYGLWETVNSSSPDDNASYRRLKKLPKYAIEQFISKHRKVEVCSDFLPNGLRCDTKCQLCNIDKAIITSSPVYNIERKRRNSVPVKSFNQDQDSNQVMSYLLASGITINSIPCRNATMATLGYTPGCHLANCMFDVVILRSITSKDIKKYNKALLNGLHVALPFVSYIRTNQMTISAKNQEQIWNELDNTEEKIVNQEDTEDIIIIDDSDSLSENENIEEDTEEEEMNKSEPENLNDIRKPRRSFDIFKKGKLKKLLKRSESITDKINSLKNEKIRKKIKKQNSQMPKWMIDYNVIDETVNNINIKLHSGLVSFFAPSL